MANPSLKEHLEEEKKKVFSIVAFGCNRLAQKQLAEKVSEPFVYYEYFLLEPVLKTNKDKEEDVEKIPIYAPFIERILEQFPFVPVVKKNNIDNYLLNGEWKKIKYVPKEREFIREFLPKILTISKFGESAISLGIYKSWKGNNEVEPFSQSLSKLPEKIAQRTEKEDKIAGLKDFLITCVPYLMHNIETVQVLCQPIASEEIFYGNLLLTYSKLSEEEKSYEENLEYLRELANSIYLPVATLFENYWEEFVIKEGLNKKKWKIRNWEDSKVTLTRSSDDVTMRLIFKACEGKQELEKPLKKVWDIRKGLFEKGDQDKLKEHLLFAKYNIASPKMLNTVKEIINLNLKKSDKSLPSVLIIGGSGVGKDTLAKLIAIFSEAYTLGDIITINMASYKPEAISTPLIAGLDTEPVKVEGIFQKLSQGSRNGNDYPTLILDELNSLDIDAQGALLRILENGEVFPMGSLEPATKDLNVLVIGVMNEDPDKLTKESILQPILTQGELFGGALGEILYEHIRKTRRLREDLYYRLKRTGKIEVPLLNNRREDIPILFYVHARDEVKNIISKDVEVRIDFDVYELLMSEIIKWPGNVRQLQSMAKTSIRIALSEKSENPNPLKKGEFVISIKDVKRALKDEKLISATDT